MQEIASIFACLPQTFLFPVVVSASFLVALGEENLQLVGAKTGMSCPGSPPGGWLCRSGEPLAAWGDAGPQVQTLPCAQVPPWDLLPAHCCAG